MLIVGGGIAGLAAAIALGRRGIAASVYERRLERADDGLGLNLPGNAIAALQALGLGDRIESLGTPTRRRQYHNAQNRLLFAVDEVAFWGARTQPRCVLRGDLVAAFLEQLPPGTVHSGVAVQRVQENGSGVEVTLDTGKRIFGSAVIGADGVRSTVRQQVTGARSPQASLISGASWRFVTDNLGIECWTAWTGTAGTVLLIPVGRGRSYGWLACRDDRLDGFPQVASAFEHFPPIVQRTLSSAAAEPRPPLHSPLEEIRPAAWARGRVILIGDAAHACAPVWAQGAALALEDALTVADVLAGTENWAHAGDEFARRRHARVAHVQLMTDRMSRTARLPAWLLDLIAPRVGPRSYRHTYESLLGAVSR